MNDASGSTAPRSIWVLKWPLAGLLLALLLGAGIIAGAIYLLQTEQQREKVTQRALRDAQARLANANKEIEDLRLSVDTYNRLYAAGAFGQERRLRWVENIKALRAQYRLQALELDMSARRPVAFPASAAFPSIDINASKIQLKVRALHDGELFSFIGDLGNSGLGLFPIDRCVMKAVAPVNDDPLAPRMEGDCVLHWVTIVDKRAVQSGIVGSGDPKALKNP